LPTAPPSFLVCYEHISLLHEGTHYVDADLDGTRAIEQHSGHERAVFGEGIGSVASATPGVLLQTRS
jgi:hypothetical protein